MGLREGQTAITTGKLYECARIFTSSQDPYIANLFVVGDTVNVYGSNSATKPANLAAMVLQNENTGVTGTLPFFAVPRYIAISGGTPTEMVITGLAVKEIGAIS